MPTGMAVLVNGAMSGQELLGLPGRLEPLHAPFALAGRLMRILRTIVEVAALSVLDVRDDRPLGRGVAFQLIGHHGTYCKPFSSFLKKRLAALVLRRLWTRTSRTAPS